MQCNESRLIFLICRECHWSHVSVVIKTCSINKNLLASLSKDDKERLVPGDIVEGEHASCLVWTNNSVDKLLTIFDVLISHFPIFIPIPGTRDSFQKAVRDWSYREISRRSTATPWRFQSNFKAVWNPQLRSRCQEISRSFRTDVYISKQWTIRCCHIVSINILTVLILRHMTNLHIHTFTIP